MLLIVSFASLLLFFLQTAAVTTFTSKPAKPSFVEEFQDITLVWNYTLDGTVGQARFINNTGGANYPIAAKFGNGNTDVVTKYQQRFRAEISNTHARLTILGAQRADQGIYELDITTSNIVNLNDEMQLIVQFPAKFFNNVSGNQSVPESSDLQLHCGASGNRPPNITWIRVFTNGSESQVLHGMPTWNIANINRTDTGIYQCTASNGVGDAVRHTLMVNVLFPSKIVNLPSQYRVAVQQSVTLQCQAEGNPKPSFTWTPCNQNVCDKSTLFISQVLNDTVFTCIVKNNQGPSDSANTNVVIADKEINITLTITSESCTNGQYNKTLLENRVTKEIDNIFAVESAYTSTTLKDVRCGSLIVDLILKFSSLVSNKWALSILKEATKDGKLGEFNVAASSIKRTRPVISTSTSPLTGKTTPRLSDGNMIWIIVGAVLGCTFFIAIIVAVVVLYARKQKKKSKNDKKISDKPGESHTVSYAESAGNTYNNAVEMEVRQPHHIPSWQQTSEVPSRSQYMALDDARRSDDLPEVATTTDTTHTSQYAPLHPSTLSREILRENVTIEKIIGKGAFGQVAKGTVFGIRGRAEMTLVAVKMLKANATVSDMNDLLSELEVMKTLKPHPHVIKLLGCVTESEPLLVLIEYVPYGDLLGYLRKSRGLNDTYYQDPDIKPQTSLTSQQLMKFAWQIADGMSYLSSRSIIHRDLAARNVLVGEKETCKVTDFGMARDVQQENIYERKTKGRLPVKWTAYESLMYGKYTTKSDVWSYGVLLYEIFTIGGSPYPRMDGRKIASLLQQGYRMPKPQHVDDELYEMMTTCWEENPDIRPTFGELRNKLKKMENRHKRLINMKIYDTQLYANVEDLVM